jgi:hypothetical protein
MPPDLHLVHIRPPTPDVPPLVWIDPPGTPRSQLPNGPLWEWPAPPPRRSWRPASRIAFAIVITPASVTADEAAVSSHPLPILLPARSGRVVRMHVVAIGPRARPSG